MPRLKRPYVATLDEVRISRDRETAIIEYRNPGVATTYFPLGAQVHSMTDQEILGAEAITPGSDAGRPRADRLVKPLNHAARCV